MTSCRDAVIGWPLRRAIVITGRHRAFVIRNNISIDRNRANGVGRRTAKRRILRCVLFRIALLPASASALSACKFRNILAERQEFERPASSALRTPENTDLRRDGGRKQSLVRRSRVSAGLFNGTPREKRVFQQGQTRILWPKRDLGPCHR